MHHGILMPPQTLLLVYLSHRWKLLQGFRVCTEISRIELLINSSRLSSKLQLELHVSPVSAAWAQQAGEPF